MKSVTINLTRPDMHFSNPASPTTGFRLGTLHGVTAADVTATRSADLTSLTLTFAPGTFGRGDFLTFANFAFPVELPVQFQVDADRVQGGQIVVTFSDNSTSTGTFFVEPFERVNNFTGSGTGERRRGDATGARQQRLTEKDDKPRSTQRRREFACCVLRGRGHPSAPNLEAKHSERGGSRALYP